MTAPPLSPLHDAILNHPDQPISSLLTTDTVRQRETDESRGFTALHFAARHGNLQACKAIVQFDKSAALLRDNFGWIPLARACESGKTEIVRFLLEQAPDTLNSVDDNLATPLHRASGSGAANIVELLCTLGADVNKHDGRRQETPLHYAALKGHAA
jgi:ankyrin repeat protein